MTQVEVTGTITKFHNCRLLKNHSIYWEDIWVRDGIIIDPQKCFYGERRDPDIKVNCGGNIIAPGYIETQINDMQVEIKKVAEGLMAHGVTSFCPTVITSPSDVYRKILPTISRCNGSREGAGVLGLHLEGPFISKAKKGAHPEECIASDLTGGLTTVDEMYGSHMIDRTSIVTIAPELPGALEVISALSKDRGIRVSIGHSEGTIKDGERAVRAGATFITHLFNAMLPFHHRDPGLVGLLTSWKLPKDSMVYYGIIADGIHTHPATMRIAHRTHPNGIVLVSDSMCAAGLSPGTYHFGQQTIDVKEKKAYVAGTETLAGSIAFLDECVQTFYNGTECSKVEALEAATLHPALLLGIEDRKGTLEYGTDADFLILDDDLQVTHTYIGGQCVYKLPTSLIQL
ncbi:N-acetylglucosamine-6-phosphate deacetylase-like isoform X2 [Watersipora subatra]|uniref:N-acetylglucosamine-6-phosphate deacetylase-like isoform X2 n=1 Tax=Watersipora subatra TaxID=2589382 RepID=UPI00355B1914